MENAAIITRVSTPGQADNTSPATQLERCRSYCAAKDYRVFAEASEVISGSFVLARSEFIRLQELANEGKISVIVVDISDRLGRGDAAAQLEMLAKLSGARVEYATPGRDTSTVEGLALKATDQLVSGIERMNIRRRVTDGKRPRAAEGRVIESSCRPYGYDFLSTRDKHGRKNSCTLVIREDEAQIVRNIYEWAVFEGLSTYAVAKRLMTLCVPTMRDKEPRGQPKETKYLWRQPVVFGILTNPVYKGKWHYNPRVVRIKDSLEGPRQEYITTNNPDYIPVPVPAIVTEALWEAAQEKLEDNRRKFRRPTKYEYPLRGRIRCAACGYLMTGAGYHRRNKPEPERVYKCCHNRTHYGEYRCKADR